jgi:hypothetical protein
MRQFDTEISHIWIHPTINNWRALTKNEMRLAGCMELLRYINHDHLPFPKSRIEEILREHKKSSGD